MWTSDESKWVRDWYPNQNIHIRQFNYTKANEYDHSDTTVGGSSDQFVDSLLETYQPHLKTPWWRKLTDSIYTFLYRNISLPLFDSLMRWSTSIKKQFGWQSLLATTSSLLIPGTNWPVADTEISLKAFMQTSEWGQSLSSVRIQRYYQICLWLSQMCKMWWRYPTAVNIDVPSIVTPIRHLVFYGSTISAQNARPSMFAS